MKYEWDGRKAKANERKHGVSFTEAATVAGVARRVDRPNEDHQCSADDTPREEDL
jgi:uncharacterized DUF497 family protein